MQGKYVTTMCSDQTYVIVAPQAYRDQKGSTGVSPVPKQKIPHILHIYYVIILMDTLNVISDITKLRHS